MIQPLRGRGLAVSLAACDAAGVGSAGGAAIATLAGKVPSTPGRAPGGGGGSASPAGAGAAARAGSVRAGSVRAGSARAGSFGRGRPANGAVAADATVLFPFTLKVFTITGWIGSLDPGAARCGAADADGRSRCTGTLLALARSKRWPSGFASADAARTAAGSFLAISSLIASTLGPSFLAASLLGVAASAIIGAVRLVAAEGTYWLRSSRMRESRLPALDPPSTTATTWRLSRRSEVTRLKPEALVKPVLMPSTPSTRPSRRL